jgi:hypothetical protein
MAKAAPFFPRPAHFYESLQLLKGSALGVLALKALQGAKQAVLPGILLLAGAPGRHCASQLGHSGGQEVSHGG